MYLILNLNNIIFKTNIDDAHLSSKKKLNNDKDDNSHRDGIIRRLKRETSRYFSTFIMTLRIYVVMV